MRYRWPMTLDDAQRLDLVAHLADRLPSYQDRSAAARGAGLGDTQLTGEAILVWALLVREAEERRRLTPLLSEAARVRPGDPVLTQLATSAADGALVVPKRDRPGEWVRGALIAGAVVAALGAIALFADLSGLTQSFAPPAPAASTAPPIAAALGTPLATPPAAPVQGSPVADAAQPSASNTPLATAGDGTSAGGETAPPPLEAPADPPPTTAAPSNEATGGGLCPGSPTQIIGYAYAGETAPAVATWRLPAGRNVRADYPRRENSWNSRSPVVCVLPRGSTLRIERPPIRVDGDAYWIPVVGGAATAP
ncbi:MAG: effector-associated domain EAD1-containing protein [Myxococcota bacterium]